MALGEGVEITGPQWVRDRMREAGRRLLKEYE